MNAGKELLGGVVGVAQTPWNLVKGVAHTEWEAMGGLNPFAEMSPLARFQRVEAGATLGLSDIARKNVNANLDEADRRAALEGRSAGIEDYTLAGLRSVWDTLTDIGGKDKWKEAYSGKKVAGTDPTTGETIYTDLTPYERGKSFGEAATATGLVLAAARGNKGGAVEPIGLPKDFAALKPLGDIADARAARLGIPRDEALRQITGRRDAAGTPPEEAAGPINRVPLNTAEAGETPTTLPHTTKAILDDTPGKNGTPSALKQYEGVTDVKELFTLPQQGKIITDAINRGVLKTFIAKTKLKEGEEFNKISSLIVNHAAKGLLSPEVMRDVLETNDLNPEQASTLIADRLQKTASFEGSGLKQWSDVVKDMYTETVAKANAGDAEAAKTQKVFEDFMSKARGEKPYTWLDKTSQWYKGLVVGVPSTTLKIAISEGNVAVSQILGHMISGTTEMLVGKSRSAMGLPEGRTLADYYGDLLGDIGALPHIIKQNPAITEVLNNVPLNKQDFLRGAELDVTSNILRNGELGKGQDFANGMDKVTQFLTMGHRSTTWLGRNFFFESRLRGNLSAAGKTLADLNTELQGPAEGRGAWVQPALEDAFGHMMKQTFQYVPKDGFTANVLAAYKALGPAAPFILPTFPRFMMNTFRWQMDHSPTGMLDLFKSDFRDQLAEGGMGGRLAARRIGDAMTGALTLSGAWAIRNSDMGGPKFYQINAGKDADGNTKYLDMRAYLPMAPYLFFAHLMQHTVSGEPMNLTPAEWGDAITGIRSIANTPINMVQQVSEQLSNTNSEDTIPAAVKKMLGNWAAGFFRPLKELEPIIGLARPEEAVTRDLHGNELTGPVVSSIPGLSETLPASMSMFKGEPKTQEHPIFHETGAEVHAQTKLEQLVNRLPGVTEAQLVGNHGTDEANRAVAASIGKILRSDTSDGNLGDNIASLIEDTHADPQLQRELLLKLMDKLRRSAVRDAIRSAPDAFLAGRIKKLPPSTRGPVEDLFAPRTHQP